MCLVCHWSVTGLEVVGCILITLLSNPNDSNLEADVTTGVRPAVNGVCSVITE